MTQKQRLVEFLNAWRKWLNAQRNNNPWGGPVNEPTPESYGLTGYGLLWAKITTDKERRQ